MARPLLERADDDDRRAMDADTDMLYERIASYLRQHPNAADTLEGVQSWWLRDVRGQADRRAVQQAIDRLVEDGVLSRSTAPGGRIVYARAQPRDHDT